MSARHKSKSNWFSNNRLSLLGVVVVLFVITVIFVAALTRADRNGFFQGTSQEENIESKTKESPIAKLTEPAKYQDVKTLGDWLEFLSILAVPILIAVFGYQFQQRDKQKAEDNFSEEAIKNYLDNTRKLLLDKELRKELFAYVKYIKLKLIINEELRKKLSTLSPHDQLKLLNKDNPVRDVARTQTITILRRLEADKQRQERILNFLRDAELDEFILKNANLSRANLSRAFLEKVNLEGANLSRAFLVGANLEDANLERANLSRTNLEGANLERANLWGANLE